MSLSGQGDMRDAAFDTGVIIAEAVALAELPGGTGHERVRIDWLNKRLAAAPGSRYVDGVGNLVWTFGPPDRLHRRRRRPTARRAG
jgi:putative aminopeptidase FrvX